MNGKQLKNSILQWAIQGKLVPQDPNDEPASVLLEKIRAEKARLVKEGKLKKIDLEVKPIAEDEIPFEIPESWEWCRLGEVCNDISDIDHKMPQVSEKGIPYISPLNFRKDGSIDYENAKKICVDDFKQLSKKCKPERGDLIFPRYGTIGVLRKVETDMDFLVSYSCATIKPHLKNIDADYLYNVLISPLIQRIEIQRYINKTTQPNIGLQSIKLFLVPLPPLAEQHRIVAKIEELMPLVEKYDAAQEALDEWNQTMPEKLKKSILQEAIQGKLVPQDPTDEPASVLLRRIREEKQRLVKEGKLKKKDLEVKPIEEDEIPFEIPDNWEWVRLGSLCDYIHRGKSPKYGVDKTLPIIAQKCNQWDKIYTEKCLFAEKNSIESYLEEQYLQIGDTIINSTGGGTVGRTGYVDNYVFEEFTKFVADSHVTVVRANRLVNKKYVYYYLISPFIQNGLEDRCSGSTNQIELGTETIKNYRIPLPPLAEQRRIVAKIKELFGMINN